MGGPLNPRTGKQYGIESQKYLAYAETMPCDVVPLECWETLRSMRLAVFRHESARRCLEKGKPELVGRVAYRGVMSQIRCDWLTPACELVDLKTCSDISRFQEDAINYGYMYQLAFYREVLRLLTGEKFTVRIIAVEKNDTPAVSVIRLSERLLDDARDENERTLDRVFADPSYSHYREDYQCQWNQLAS